MEIPRNKPDEVWAAEWVAMHTDFVLGGVVDARFIAEFKATMIEIAGDRLYDYRGVERLLAFIQEGSCAPMERFPPDHMGYGNLKAEIAHQTDLIQGAASRWSDLDPMSLKLFPAWELETPDREEWLQRWRQAGGLLTINGKCFGKLEELPREFDAPNKRAAMEIRFVALKLDPVWASLGSSALFVDGLNVDHPPFVRDVGFSVRWRQIDHVEAVVLGLRRFDGSLLADPSTVNHQRHHQLKREIKEILAEGLRRADEAYALYHSPEAEAQRALERELWWKARELAESACNLAKAAAATGGQEQMAGLQQRMSETLGNERWSERPTGKAALHRAIGILHEAQGRPLDAAQCYVAALALDPKAGCAKDLKRLGGK